MLTNIYILIPALVNTGPIKGIIALANGLIKYYKVYIAVLKYVDKDVAALLDSKIIIVSFSSINNFWGKCSAYKLLLLNSDYNKKPISISFGFSADIVNWMLRNKVIIISSVRANLFKNYYYTYSILGYPSAWVHFKILRRFFSVIAISNSMADQLKRQGVGRISVIGNFIDEKSLEPFSKKDAPTMTGRDIRFLFLGSLTNRKRPELLINTIKKIKAHGISAQLSIVGDGPKKMELEGLVDRYDLKNNVTFYGQVLEPYQLMQNIDYMILPSESEGISRAVLEALYLGIPCILRDIDGNRELIEDSKNGFLFKTDDEFFIKMIDVSKKFKPYSIRDRKNLIPQFFRQDENIKKYVDLLQAILSNR